MKELSTKSSKSYQAFMKSPYSSIKHTSYFDVYDNIFSKYIGKKITFVEIGVLGGGSLFMWRDFFGPDARIIGIDLNPGAKRWEEDGFEIFIGSQADNKFWKDIFDRIGTVDIILDDGGHTYEQQITTFDNCLHHINDDGMIVIEDTHTSYLNKFGPRIYNFINFAHHQVNKIHDRSFVLSKNNVRENTINSIRFFQSIVVFDIDRELAGKPSDFIENNKNNTNQQDYRFYSNSLVFFLEKLINDRSNFINKLLIIKPLLKLLMYFALKYVSFITYFKLRKYFRS
tara:strand:+ start:290 stop:1144 length:855 start_codon:yes stop_codon:yes gene_type:complete